MMRGCLLESGGYIAVRVESNSYSAMAQPLLNYLDVYALLQHD